MFIPRNQRPKNFPFITLDNVIATPHLGASTQELQIEFAKLTADHVMRGIEKWQFSDAVN